MTRLPACLCLVGMLAASACSVAADPVKPSRQPVRVPSGESQAAVAAPSSKEVPAEIVDKLRADLASRHGFAASAVTVAKAESVVWPNGALGCAKPGEMVTQALVPGYRVELEAGGKRYAYHAAERGFFRLCDNEVQSGLDRSSIK